MLSRASNAQKTRVVWWVFPTLWKQTIEQRNTRTTIFKHTHAAHSLWLRLIVQQDLIDEEEYALIKNLKDYGSWLVGLKSLNLHCPSRNPYQHLPWGDQAAVPRCLWTSQSSEDGCGDLEGRNFTRSLTLTTCSGTVKDPETSFQWQDLKIS